MVQKSDVGGVASTKLDSLDGTVPEEMRWNTRGSCPSFVSLPTQCSSVFQALVSWLCAGCWRHSNDQHSAHSIHSTEWNEGHDPRVFAFSGSAELLCIFCLRAYDFCHLQKEFAPVAIGKASEANIILTHTKQGIRDCKFLASMMSGLMRASLKSLLNLLHIFLWSVCGHPDTLHYINTTILQIVYTNDECSLSLVDRSRNAVEKHFAPLLWNKSC